MAVKIQDSIWTKQIIILLISSLIFLPMMSFASETRDADTTPLPTNPPQKKVSIQRKPFVPGDAIMISVFPDTSSFLNQIFPIDDRGYVELPIYGKVKITNMSESELIEFLKTKYRDYLRYPFLQVKPLIRVSILGGIPRPGLYYFDPDRSLWDLLYMAGGTTDEDGLKQMRWERDRKVIKKNLIPYFQSGSSLKSIGFRSGDQIWVRTPGKPGFWEKFARFLPLVTLTTTIFTLYLTYQRTAVAR